MSRLYQCLITVLLEMLGVFLNTREDNCQLWSWSGNIVCCACQGTA